jgi:hypothetical protein
LTKRNATSTPIIASPQSMAMRSRMMRMVISLMTQLVMNRELIRIAQQTKRLSFKSQAYTLNTHLNSANQRIRKFVWQGNNVLANVRFDYDLAGNLLAESRWNSDAPKQEIVWMGNLPVAVFDQDESNQVKPYFIYTDGLGTPRTIVDANQDAVCSCILCFVG